MYVYICVIGATFDMKDFSVVMSSVLEKYSKIIDSLWKLKMYLDESKLKMFVLLECPFQSQ